MSALRTAARAHTMRRRRAGSRASTASVDPGRGRPGRQDRSSRRAFGSVPCERTRAPVGLRGRGESLAVHRDAALPWSASARRSLRDDELGRCGERKCCAAARGAMSREINIRGTSSHSGRAAAGGSRTIRAVASIGVWTPMGGWKGGRADHTVSRGRSRALRLPHMGNPGCPARARASCFSSALLLRQVRSLPDLGGRSSPARITCSMASTRRRTSR